MWVEVRWMFGQHPPCVYSLIISILSLYWVDVGKTYGEMMQNLRIFDAKHAEVFSKTYGSFGAELEK